MKEIYNKGKVKIYRLDANNQFFEIVYIDNDTIQFIGAYGDDNQCYNVKYCNLGIYTLNKIIAHIEEVLYAKE